MTHSRFDDLVSEAVNDGLLPVGADSEPVAEQRPWPIVVLTGLGAWLAAVPLLLVVGMLIDFDPKPSVGPYMAGILLLTGAQVVLRSSERALFLEQLMVPILLAGSGALSFGLFRDLPYRGAAGLLVVMALALALLVPQRWLRALLGAMAALLAGVALMPDPESVLASLSLMLDSERFHAWSPALSGWLAWDAVLAAWAGTVLMQDRAALTRLAAWVEVVASGWLAATLVALALFSGTTLLGGAFIGGAPTVPAIAVGLADAWQWYAVQGTSVVIGLAAACTALVRWPSLRRPAPAALALILVALCGFMPSLGSALFALAWCATSRRWTLAIMAATAGLWIVGAFYYQLQWPLTTKALVLVLAGIATGALACVAYRAAPGPAPGGQPSNAPVRLFSMLFSVAPATVAARSLSNAWAAALLTAAAVVTLGVINISIWQKERLLANGQPLFVALAPVDPRSLVQGDHMRLEFAMPVELHRRLDTLGSGLRPKVVVRRDERGVGTILGIAEGGGALAADEILLELRPKGGRWIVVTDAWFFPEGEASRWQPAKYGELRVERDGRALLVGLRGEDLRPL